MIYRSLYMRIYWNRTLRYNVQSELRIKISGSEYQMARWITYA